MEKENREIIALGLAVKARIDSGESQVNLADIVSDAKVIMEDAGDDGSDDEEDELQSGARAPPELIQNRRNLQTD